MQPLPTKFQTVKEWLGDKLSEPVHTWGKGNFRGDLWTPETESVVLQETLVLPVRACLRGHSFHLDDMPGFIAGDDFPPGEPIVRFMDPAGQGEFWQGIENVSFRCRGIANGPKVTGDEISRYHGVYVDGARDVGLSLSGVSRATFQDVQIRNGEIIDGKVVPRGLGIYARASDATLRNVFLHRCDVGIHYDRCVVHGISEEGTRFEHVRQPWQLDKVVSWQSRSAGIRKSGELLLLADRSRIVHMDLTAINSEPMARVEIDGKSHFVGGRPDSETSGQFFEWPEP